MAEFQEYTNEADLLEAVERTGGYQPWRRLFHAMNGSCVVLALTFFGLPVKTGIVILCGVLLFTVALDALRLLDPKLNLWFYRTFTSLASPREKKKVASSTWYALSTVVVLLLFPLEYALAGILVLAWADPAANVVGQRWGKSTFLGGTLRGTATFVVVAFLALLFFVPWPWALATALVTGMMEALPIDVDDNLFVPIFVAGFLFLIAG